MTNDPRSTESVWDSELEILAWRDRWQVKLDLSMHQAAPKLRASLSREMKTIPFLILIFRPRSAIKDALENCISEWTDAHALPIIEQGRMELLSILSDLGRSSHHQTPELPDFDIEGPELLQSLGRVAGPAIAAVAAQIAITFWGTTTVTSGFWIFTTVETAVAWWVLPLTVVVWLLALVALITLLTMPGRIRRQATARAIATAEKVVLGSSGVRVALCGEFDRMADAALSEFGVSEDVHSI